MTILLFSFGATSFAAEIKGEVRVSGILYWVNGEGKEMPPSPLGRVNVGYWKGNDMYSSFKAIEEDGKLITISLIGTSKVKKDGSFDVVVNLSEIPEEQKVVWLVLDQISGSKGLIMRNQDGNALKIQIEASSKKSKVD